MNTTAITFEGNLAGDPALRYAHNGNPVAEVRVLVNRRNRTSEGEWVDAEPNAFTCKTWGALAENLTGSVGKGDRVLVHGHVETETWADRETGEKRSKQVVIVDAIGVSLTWATASPTRNPTKTPSPTTDDNAAAPSE